MTQLADYRTNVRMLGYDGVSDPLVDVAIMQARRRVTQDRRWSFMLADSQVLLSTAANVSEVALAAVTDLQYVESVRLLEGNDPLNLHWRSYQLVKDLRAGDPGNSGTPAFWTKRNANLLFYPTPDRVLTVDLDYVAKIADLAAGVDDVIPDQHQDLVVWAAVVPLAFRQRGSKEAAAADSHYRDVLFPRHAAQDGTEQRQTSRQVRSGYWD